MPSGVASRPKPHICARCGGEYLRASNAQKYCLTCRKTVRSQDVMRSFAAHKADRLKYRKRWLSEQTEKRVARRLAIKEARFKSLYRGAVIDDFFAAVNGPLRKWDRKMHIKCGMHPSMMLCGRSHVFRKRWLRPAPNRNVTCKKCLAIWKRLYGDAPIPVLGSDDWTHEEKQQWGF